MRIGLVISGNLHTVTGGYIYDRHVVEYLQRQGHSVEIVTLPAHDYFSRLGVNFRWASLEALARLRVDALLQDELEHPALFLLNRRLKARVTYPLISIVHHLRTSEPRWRRVNDLYRMVERSYLATIDGFVFNSETTRRSVQEIDGNGKPGVIARPCGDRLPQTIGGASIAARARQRGPLRVIFVGNVIPRKGLHILLDAIAQLPSHVARLTVVGELRMDPGYARKIEDGIKRRRLQDRVELAGAVPDGHLAVRMAQSHILAVPSTYEGFGIVYLEGMAAGLPAIGTLSGAASEVISHGRNGFLIPAGDSARLAEHFRRLYEDRRLLVECSLRAWQTYQDHPTWEKSCAKISGFIQRVVEGYRKPEPVQGSALPLTTNPTLR